MLRIWKLSICAYAQFSICKVRFGHSTTACFKKYMSLFCCLTLAEGCYLLYINHTRIYVAWLGFRVLRHLIYRMSERGISPISCLFQSATTFTLFEWSGKPSIPKPNMINVDWWPWLMRKSLIFPQNVIYYLSLRDLIHILGSSVFHYPQKLCCGCERE